MRKIFLFITLVASSFYGCKDEEKEDARDSFPLLDRGDVQIDAFQLILTDNTTGLSDSFGYDYLAKRTPPIDTIRWNATDLSKRSYDVDLQYYFQGKPVNSAIEQNGVDYFGCFRELNFNFLLINAFDQDQNGEQIGLKSKWEVEQSSKIPDGIEFGRITMQYVKIEKELLCNQGVNIFDGYFPSRIYKDNRGILLVDSCVIEIENTTTNLKDTIYFGSNNPLNVDTLNWNSGSNANASFQMKARFFNENGEITSRIENQGVNYAICYDIDYPSVLTINSQNMDDFGMPLGTQSTWTVNGTQNIKSGKITFKLNYQSWSKSTTNCSYGINKLMFEIPYKVI